MIAALLRRLWISPVLSRLFARCIQESAEWPALAEVARTIAPA